MRRHSCRLVAWLLLAACTGDYAGNTSPRTEVSRAYLSVSPTSPAAGSIVTMTIRPGPGDAVLGSFAARVHLPQGVSYVADRGEGARAVRASGDTVIVAAAAPNGFGDALFAFDVRVDVPANLAAARLEMTEFTSMTLTSATALDSSIAGAVVAPIWGDITFDGTIAAADAQGILNASLSLTVPGTYQVPLGDANCDGIIAAADALIVLAKVVGTNVAAFCVSNAATIVMSGEVRDAVSFQAVPNAKLVLTQAGADAAVALPREAKTDANGAYVFYNNVPDGTYSFAVTGAGYLTANAPVAVIDATKPRKIELTLTPGTFSTQQFASVTGRVVTSAGAPVAGAAVQLSGGVQTNGAFKATTTTSDGSFSFAGVALTDQTKVPIPSFKLTAKALNGDVGASAAVVLTANEVKTGVDITVAPSGFVATSFFSEGFDSGIPGTWTATGIWTHRNSTPITNKAFPTHVKVAANDPSLGAVPFPMTGAGAAWAGFTTTGNFIGTQTSGDSPLSGGQGDVAQEGLLKSPIFAVPAGVAHATLYFDAWFEVESVNPNASGFDIMEVTVTDVAASKTTSLTRLNPFEDPPLSNRAAIPFTSGGFNRNPVWRPVYFNLDAYKGKTIQLGFCFRTVDPLYNGFRGWLIDNVRVSDESALGGPSLGTVTGISGSRVGVGRPVKGLSPDMASSFVSSCELSVEDVPVASVGVTPSPVSLKITETAQLLATPFDAFGVGLAGRFTLWTSSNSTVASVSTEGLVTAKANGTATITANVDGQIGVATVTVGLPTSTLAISAGDNQTAVVNQAVPILPSVKITSAAGKPVAGAVVTFDVASGGGVITGASTTTNAAGIATIGRWNLGATPGTNTIIASSPAATNSPVTFTATGSAAGINLTIENLYITQATQTMANDVPLVAGRPALIRVFVKAAAANSAKPAVRVDLIKAGSVVKTYTIAAPSTSTTISVVEATVAQSWNLLIPAADLEPGMSVLAEVDPTNAVTETSDADNTYPKSGTPMPLDVRSVPTFNVMFVPVTQPGGVTANISDANKDAFLDFAKRVYPVGAIDAIVHAPFTYGKTLSSGYDATWTDLLLQMKTLRIAEVAPGATRHYYGVVHPTYVAGGTGLAYVGDPAAVGVDLTTSITGNSTDVRAYTAAHEFGHNFDRRHVNCGNPANIDAAYPYTTTSIGANGYDVFKDKFIALGSNADIMSYCPNPWISDYSYKAILEYRAVAGGPMFSQQSSGAPARGMLLWGQIGPDGIKLEPSFEVNANPSLPAKAGSNSIQALDANGQTIFNLSFEGDEVDHMPGVRHFAYVVPLPANVAAPTALRLRANGRELTNRASANTAPTAPRLSRIAGGSRLQWNATEYPMAMVRDAATGQILSFARGGSAEVLTRGANVEVVLSNGVTSTIRRLQVP